MMNWRPAEQEQPSCTQVRVWDTTRKIRLKQIQSVHIAERLAKAALEELQMQVLAAWARGPGHPIKTRTLCDFRVSVFSHLGNRARRPISESLFLLLRTGL